MDELLEHEAEPHDEVMGDDKQVEVVVEADEAEVTYLSMLIS